MRKVLFSTVRIDDFGKSDAMSFDRQGDVMLEKYISRFENLSTDAENGRPRPHKAVMLLSVITLADSGRLLTNNIIYGPELLEVFSALFETVRAGTDRCTPHNPFFYLKSDAFWHLHPQPSQEAVLRATRSIKGPGQLMELVSYASLDADLFVLLADRVARERLRNALIGRYFPNRAAEVLELCSQEKSISDIQHVLEDGQSDATSKTAEVIRDAAFSRTIRKVYDYTCAMCGVRFVCNDVFLVDAAHLIPFSESQNDSPTNGIALCKNHHWLMDKFLIAPAPRGGRDYSRPIWLVSDMLDNRLEAHRACVEYRNQSVILPKEQQHMPDHKSIDWRVDKLRG